MRKTKLIHYNCSYEKYRSYKSKRFNGVLKPDILGRTNEYHGTMDQTLMMTPASQLVLMSILIMYTAVGDWGTFSG